MSDPTMHGSSGDWNKLKHLVDLSAENARLKAEVGELADALKLASEVGIKIADEVTRLKAEVERLKAYNEEALAHIAKEERKSRECLDMEQAENARLKDDVELLTKQRDIALCDFWNIHRGYFDLKAEVERLRKEGKQP